MVASHEWRPRLYARAGVCERPDHAASVRTHREVSGGRSFEPARAHSSAALFRACIHRNSPGRRHSPASLAYSGHGVEWFERDLLPRFAPVTISALLATLVLIFAFQAD